MKKNLLSVLFLVIVISFNAPAQIGGNSVFSFLNLNSSARIAAQGGTYIAVNDNDPNLATLNPALLKASMNNMVSFSGVKYFADVNGGDVSYTCDYEKLGTFQAAIHYINYGKFKEADIYGNINGEFTAADYDFQIGWGRKLNRYFSVGSDIKFIYSHLETYSSTGLACDMGVNFSNDSSTSNTMLGAISLSLLARNIGGQLKKYNENSLQAEPLKTEVMFGMSYKLPHAPFRFIFTYRHLEKFDLTYVSPLNESVDPLTGTETKVEYDFPLWNKVSRHLIIGTELVFSKNFYISFALNCERLKELRLYNAVGDDATGLTGLSAGFGLKVSRFYISYAYAAYHVAGGVNHLTIATNPFDFFHKATTAN